MRKDISRQICDVGIFDDERIELTEALKSIILIDLRRASPRKAFLALYQSDIYPTPNGPDSGILGKEQMGEWRLWANGKDI